LAKGFAIGLGKKTHLSLDAETGMDPGRNYISAGLVDKLHFQKYEEHYL